LQVRPLDEVHDPLTLKPSGLILSAALATLLSLGSGRALSSKREASTGAPSETRRRPRTLLSGERRRDARRRIRSGLRSALGVPRIVVTAAFEKEGWRVRRWVFRKHPLACRRRRWPFVYPSLRVRGLLLRVRAYTMWERHAAAPPCAARASSGIYLSLSLSFSLSLSALLMPRVCPSHESACGWAADAMCTAAPRDARENRAPFRPYVCAHSGTRASARVPVPRRETG